MHIEHNVLESVLKYFFEEWNTMEVCKNMEEVGVKWHLWLHRNSMGTNYVKPLASYVFTWKEKQAFLNFVSEVHAQIVYADAFKKHVAPNMLYNMISHEVTM
jgi:hypothetical protein